MQIQPDIRVGTDVTRVTEQAAAAAVQPQPAPQALPATPAAGGSSKVEHVQDAVQMMGKYVKLMNESEVHFDYDKDIDRVIVKYVSPNSGEVVNQIPSKDFVEFEKEFVKTIGLLFDKKA